MTNDELILIRDNQKECAYKLKQLENYKQKILELEQNLIVKEYCELKKILEQNTEESIKTKSKNDINKILFYTKESKKILYDYGKVLVETDEGYCGDEDLFPEYHVYRDLETTEYYFEYVFDSLKLMPPEWKIGYPTLDAEYFALRTKFIEQIQYKEQEVVLSKLLKENKKLVKMK